jgi:hypothetical protein
VREVSPVTHRKPTRWIRFAGPAVVLLAAAVAVAPQLIHGPSCGHDFDFHLVSWLDALSSWQHGIPYPHWAASANFGAGEPRFLFYPPLTWMLGAGLGMILPWQLVPVTLTFLLLAAGGLATRTLARQALDDSTSTLAGCAALFSGYALFSAYERSAFGELSGGFWIPLLLLFLLRERNPAGLSAGRSLALRVFDGSTSPLAFVLAGCWLSNLPLGVMACYLLAAVATASAMLARSWTPILRSAAAAVLGIGLASIYLLPAVFEQRWVDIRQLIDDPGERIENSWLFARHADPALAPHDTVLLKASIIAATMLAVALISLLILRLRGRLAQENPSSPRHWWLPLALIPPAILFLQLPISLPVWNLLPKLRFLQFPWRWLVTLEAPMAIFFARAVWPARRWRRLAVAALCAVLFLAASAFTAHNFFQPCDDEDNVSAMAAVYRSGAGFAGTDEYAPPGADNTLLPAGLPAACLVSDPAAILGKGTGEAETIPAWNPAQGSCLATLSWQLDRPERKRLHAIAPHAGFLLLRLRSYPAWRIVVNGRTIGALPRRDDGLMAVPVPQGEVDLAVDWATTPDVLAGRWLSVLAVLLLAALWLLERRLQNFLRPQLS